jgi:hypothetical protein
MGCRDFFRVFKDHIPILPHTTSIIILIINIFFPGFGTFCLICLGGGDFWVEHLMIGLIQLFCTPFMIGWIWSLAWGIHTVRKSA